MLVIHARNTGKDACPQLCNVVKTDQDMMHCAVKTGTLIPYSQIGIAAYFLSFLFFFAFKDCTHDGMQKFPA